ncbi:MAG TPA: zinc ribbon domain-containing protein [Candidatus Nitrosotalea sp.]|nr:zinc ribbon domain-containing protein [Candidatus Nitrosotalea sp.]
MTKFEDALKNNVFLCSNCTKCQHFVWPPSEFCNKCFGNVVWIPVSRNAKLIEVSSKDGKNFCIAEFEGSIRVFGTIQDTIRPTHDQNLILEHCSYDGTPRFVFKIN